MSYQALYRKFRPNEFHDVKGQKHIVTTLKNQIKAERIGHAYLFCGTRGTGKTTIAKIFAKAVNCENPVDGNPCNECETCKRINAGNSMNVIEIDAASNNGVDNIRKIREEVEYSPTQGKYKVYIIDEVHMLSIGAFNALLKTLEEPPSYVIFILATTEAHKIPITILSRCQRYDFKRISAETISNRLNELMQKENMEVEEKALRYIAKAADGSMRDALSLLDQCIAFYLGEKLTYENTLEVLGAVDTTIFSNMLRKILDKDIIGLIHLLDDLIMHGREISQFIVDFTWYLRNLLLVKTTKESQDLQDIIDMSDENLSRLKEEAKMLDAQTLMRYIKIFSELSGQIKYSTQKRVMTEVALIKLCTPAMDKEQDLSNILERLKDVEKKLESGIIQTNSQPKANISTQNTDINTKGQKQPDKTATPTLKALPEDIKAVVQNWHGIIQEMSSLTRTYLKSAKLSLGNDNRLQIAVNDEVALRLLGDDGHKEEIKQIIQKKSGRIIEIEIIKPKEDSSFEDNHIDIEKLINMEIVIED